MHKPYLLWERMEKIQEDTLCGLLLGWWFFGGLASSGVEAGQDLQFFNPGRTNAYPAQTTDRKPESEVQCAIYFSRGGRAHQSRRTQPGAAPQVKRKRTASGTTKAFSFLHVPQTTLVIYFLSTDCFK